MELPFTTIKGKLLRGVSLCRPPELRGLRKSLPVKIPVENIDEEGKEEISFVEILDGKR